jgi:hypothetical protein
MRGQGVGTALLDFVELELSIRGIDDLRVAVMAGIVLYRFGDPHSRSGDRAGRS